ncbi:MAG: hypothetical protein PVF15_07830 [Candidatus Bathyarchaeota archaeon]
MAKSNFESCPGISKFVRPVLEYFKCLGCGGEVEIWSDEDVGTCTTCNKESGKPQKEQSCLDWCEYADKCREIVSRTKR